MKLQEVSAPSAVSIVNGHGYIHTNNWEPLGQRIDKWLRPGEENEIEIYDGFHMNMDTNPGDTIIRSIRLEAYPAVKREASYTPVE